LRGGRSPNGAAAAGTSSFLNPPLPIIPGGNWMSRRTRGARTNPTGAGTAPPHSRRSRRRQP